VTTLDKSSEEYVEYGEVESMLDKVQRQIAEYPKPHFLHQDSHNDEDTHQFLRSIIGTTSGRIANEVFKRIVTGWSIPSLEYSIIEQDKAEQEENDRYLRAASLARRWCAYWSLCGPKVMFTAVVFSANSLWGVADGQIHN
jgi:dual oxidase